MVALLKIAKVNDQDAYIFKTVYGLAGRKTQNEDTLHADLILSGITQLITVILANAIKHPECIRTIKSFIA